MHTADTRAELLEWQTSVRLTGADRAALERLALVEDRPAAWVIRRAIRREIAARATSDSKRAAEGGGSVRTAQDEAYADSG